MANRTHGLSEALYDYLLGVSLREPDVLRELREATEQEEYSQMRSAPEQGQFMAMLLKLTGARRVLEVGTYTGYATLWMAQALPEDGQVITCDLSERWTFVARRYWERAGVSAKVRLELGPALETLDSLIVAGTEPFDFAFIDADKANYENYYERCLELLNPGGLIAVDNVLWGGSVVDPDNSAPETMAIRAFNRLLHADARVELSMLPVADGLTLVRKLG